VLYGTVVDGLQLLVGLGLLIALFALPAVLLMFLAPGVFDWILHNDSRGIVFLLLPMVILGGLTLAFRAFPSATRRLFSTSGTSLRRGYLGVRVTGEDVPSRSATKMQDGSAGDVARGESLVLTCPGGRAGSHTWA
jgi:hypothetical protein